VRIEVGERRLSVVGDVFGADWSAVLQVAVGLASVCLLLVGVGNLWLSARSERRRSQPVVIHHAWGKRKFSSEREMWSTAGYLTNEGGGAAFNVRCGVQLRGRCRVPYRGREETGPPHRWRVVRAQERVPSGTQDASFAGRGIQAISIALPRFALLGIEGDPDVGRVFWCRYENAYGPDLGDAEPGGRDGRHAHPPRAATGAARAPGVAAAPAVR
jgi:hypothetical protein